MRNHEIKRKSSYVIALQAWLVGDGHANQPLHALNQDIESCNRVTANQLLVQLQQTDAAWEVATSILTSDRPFFLGDFEVEFFAV